MWRTGERSRVERTGIGVGVGIGTGFGIGFGIAIAIAIEVAFGIDARCESWGIRAGGRGGVVWSGMTVRSRKLDPEKPLSIAIAIATPIPIPIPIPWGRRKCGGGRE
jgi:hypothetical protein